MIHYDFKAIISKLSIVAIALLSLAIGGTIASHANVSAHSVRSVKKVIRIKGRRRAASGHTRRGRVRHLKRTRKSTPKKMKLYRRNSKARKSQRPVKIEHRDTSKDPVSIGPDGPENPSED